MTSFMTDGDLLAYEPNVFIDLPYASQRLVEVGDGAISGKELTSEAGGFEAMAAGGVVVIGSEPGPRLTHAVASVDLDTQVTLSKAPVGLDGAEGLAVVGRTFGPQIDLMHGQLMHALGLGSADPQNALDESAVISFGVVQRIEALGVLWLAYHAAAAMVGDNTTVRAKARHYRLRYRAELNGAAVLIDTDGDGQGDVWRRPGVMGLMRI